MTPEFWSVKQNCLKILLLFLNSQQNSGVTIVVCVTVSLCLMGQLVLIKNLKSHIIIQFISIRLVTNLD
jgi:hypothetical protein